MRWTTRPEQYVGILSFPHAETAYQVLYLKAFTSGTNSTMTNTFPTSQDDGELDRMYWYERCQNSHSISNPLGYKDFWTTENVDYSDGQKWSGEHTYKNPQWFGIGALQTLPWGMTQGMGVDVAQNPPWQEWGDFQKSRYQALEWSADCIPFQPRVGGPGGLMNHGLFTEYGTLPEPQNSWIDTRYKNDACSRTNCTNTDDWCSDDSLL